ncbi:Guanyl-specific ribonuclease [Hortaea werneckii]|nr:Guanyl-specific ribonuclease [Hortaea werneckii]KAI7077221.1 Guanyl-specific ribonuclease [Hortaea werneckii]KAI7207426.1 Guanyl-specific ribonuclease [Hortaea werneckii]KAI7291122.1 Guanyl-specific ribonuclease [Hortaea werneckii]KAI7375526.1 Guanyl-specific ribonuclease [Hortaea werneckii]
MRLLISTIALMATTAFAAPLLEERQSATTCGSNYYSYSQVRAAVNSGCSYVAQGGTACSGSYPHVYNNYEGFDFPVDGTYYEFPILESGQFTCQSPGADRVVFTADCQYAGAITHTGASGNNFVGCSGTS